MFKHLSVEMFLVMRQNQHYKHDKYAVISTTTHMCLEL